VPRRPNDIEGLAKFRDKARTKAKVLTNELIDRVILAFREADFTSGAGIEADNMVWIEFKPNFKKLLLDLGVLKVSTGGGEVIGTFANVIALADVLRSDLPPLEEDC